MQWNFQDHAKHFIKDISWKQQNIRIQKRAIPLVDAVIHGKQHCHNMICPTISLVPVVPRHTPKTWPRIRVCCHGSSLNGPTLLVELTPNLSDTLIIIFRDRISPASLLDPSPSRFAHHPPWTDISKNPSRQLWLPQTPTRLISCRSFDRVFCWYSTVLVLGMLWFCDSGD